jgi:outer membrane immunogenic protein
LKQSCLVFSLLAAAALASTAARADERNPFDGAYVGLHAGYAWQGNNGVFDSATTSTSLSGLDLNGAVIGGQLGYNAQYGWILVGVEGDATANLESDTLTGPLNESLSADIGYLASVRGRLGVVFDQVMIYGTGGVGFTEFKFTENTPAGFSGTLRERETGAVYGGGVEWKINYGVSIRGEYLHYDTGTSTGIPTTFTNADVGDNIRFNDIDVARAGLNIRLTP